jgi:ATP-dependent helicase HrpB
MAAAPLPPRLARLAIDGGEDGCALAALLSSGERLSGASDVLGLLDTEWRPATRQLVASVRAAVAPKRGRSDMAVRQAVLRAFPDRVARHRSGDELLLAGGGSAKLAFSTPAKLLVAVDIEERKEKGLPLVRLASAIEPEWLLDFYPGRMRDEAGVEWNRTAERVESFSTLLYDDLIIEESRGGVVDEELASRMLSEKALEAGVKRFIDPEELEEFLARVEFAAAHAKLPRFDETLVNEELTRLCQGLRSFAQLESAARDGGLLRSLECRFTPDQRRMLQEVAPQRLRLPSGRNTRIRYTRGQTPWVASRLQDFFGMKESPRVACGAVPLVLHLLAPNQRPVQMTTDLAGFWTRLYPQVRKELSRRYPKHAWPESPK